MADGSKRLFIAVDLPADVRAQLDDLQVRLKTGCRFVDSHPKWVPVQNLHITLVFLGQVADARLMQIHEAMARACETAEPFDLSLSGLGLFPPNSRNPKVISADVLDKQGTLKRIYRSLAEDLRAQEFAIEERSYKPHLTLARLTSVKTAARIGPLVESHREYLETKFPVQEIVLFESSPREGGVHYEPLINLPLTG